MKRFIVTLPIMPIPVNVGGGYSRPTTEVEADYFRVQDGVHASIISAAAIRIVSW